LALIFAFSADSDPYRMLPDWEEKCLSARLNGLCQDEMLGRVSHVLEYAVLAVLFSRALTWGRAPRRPFLALAAGLSAAYALLDEVHQLFVPGRTFQFFDLGLDVCGIVLGVLLYGLVKRR
jgi:VanZ family protein